MNILGIGFRGLGPEDYQRVLKGIQLTAWSCWDEDEVVDFRHVSLRVGNKIGGPSKAPCLEKTKEAEVGPGERRYLQ